MRWHNHCTLGASSSVQLPNSRRPHGLLDFVVTSLVVESSLGAFVKIEDPHLRSQSIAANFTGPQLSKSSLMSSSVTPSAKFVTFLHQHLVLSNMSAQAEPKVLHFALGKDSTRAYSILHKPHSVLVTAGLLCRMSQAALVDQH